MKKATIKGAIVASLLALTPFAKAHAQAYTENFDNIGLLAGNGWTLSNVSVPVGATGWSQGPDIAGGGPFNSYNGATNAFISANFNNTGATGTISNWLVTPTRTLRNGDVFTFYTRKPSPDSYADRLEVRLSTNGASSNVGSGAATGDFTTLLMSINPSLVLGVYPTTWTLYTVTISGLPAPTSGRIAFRYFVTSGGEFGTNSDFIGIDNVVYTPYVCPAFTMTPGGPLASGTAGTAYSTTITQTGALGAPAYSVTAGALPPGMTLGSASGTISGTPTATGTFNFTVTVSDASGCSGSTAYSILIGCPANPTSLNGLPTLCDNAGLYTLTQGSPAGGSYSGTGVSGATFDPAAGTQTITYSLVDAYGCSHFSSNPITVNTAPSVTQSPFSPVCDNSGLLALSGGSPAGGTYSGTGVSGTDFDPASGSQTVTYTYTDANGCSNTASTAITVNAAPSVTQSPIAAICEDNGILALSGGSPAGGTYTGTGVVANNFNPSFGTQTVTYSYTDGNNCSNSATATITVNALPSVSHSAIPAVCADAAPFALAGGSPAGGVYSGAGVSGGNFDPNAGTQTITYTYTDANSCSNSTTTTVTVNALPTVTLTLPVSMLCVYNSATTLSGGAPAGGSYSGTGVSGGNFDPASAGLGNQTVTYDYTDANGCANSATDNILVDECLGINEFSQEGLVAYPNPGKGVFTVSMDEKNQLTDLKVVDLQGKIMDAGLTIQGTEVSIDLTKASNGVYLLQALSNGEPVSVRLVKN